MSESERKWDVPVPSFLISKEPSFVSFAQQMLKWLKLLALPAPGVTVPARTPLRVFLGPSRSLRRPEYISPQTHLALVEESLS